MQKIISFYRFRFPFFSNNYEKTVYKAIINDIIEMLLYQEVYISKQIYTSFDLENIDIFYDSGKIELIFSQNQAYYFPKISIHIHSKKNINHKILHEILHILETIGTKNFIAEYDKKYFSCIS